LTFARQGTDVKRGAFLFEISNRSALKITRLETSVVFQDVTVVVEEGPHYYGESIEITINENGKKDHPVRIF